MSKVQIRFLTQFENVNQLMVAKESFEVSHPDVRGLYRFIAIRSGDSGAGC